MAATFLASAALMGLLVVVVIVAAARGRGWYKYAPRVATDGVSWPREGADGPGLLSRPVTWVVAFVVTTLVAVGGVFALVTDPGPATLTSPGALAVGALVIVYLVLGVYLVGRDRGHSHAMALGEATALASALFLLAIVVQLVG